MMACDTLRATPKKIISRCNIGDKDLSTSTMNILSVVVKFDIIIAIENTTFNIRKLTSEGTSVTNISKHVKTGACSKFLIM